MEKLMVEMLVQLDYVLVTMMGSQLVMPKD